MQTGSRSATGERSSTAATDRPANPLLSSRRPLECTQGGAYKPPLPLRPVACTSTRPAIATTSSTYFSGTDAGEAGRAPSRVQIHAAIAQSGELWARASLWGSMAQAPVWLAAAPPGPWPPPGATSRTPVRVGGGRERTFPAWTTHRILPVAAKTASWTMHRNSHHGWDPFRTGERA